MTLELYTLYLLRGYVRTPESLEAATLYFRSGVSLNDAKVYISNYSRYLKGV